MEIMEYALKRQLFIVGVVVVIIAIIVGAVYFFSGPMPTCRDGILNQGEEKIDCGGPCAACPVVRYGDIETTAYHSFSIDGTYDAMAQVRNPNPKHGTRSFAYTFHFFNAAKQEIGTREGRTYILAGQTRYIIENNIALSEAPAFVTFSVDNPGVWEEQEELTGQLILPIFSKKYEKVSTLESGFAKVTGVLENHTSNTFASVDVHVVLVDANKKPIAAGKTQINSVRFGEQRAFVVLFPKEIPLPADIYAEAVTNVLDEANFR